LTENQPINAQWDATLASISESFSSLGAGFAMPASARGFWPGRL
jgi:hypothetical protein